MLYNYSGTMLRGRQKIRTWSGDCDSTICTYSNMTADGVASSGTLDINFTDYADEPSKRVVYTHYGMNSALGGYNEELNLTIDQKKLLKLTPENARSDRLMKL